MPRHSTLWLASELFRLWLQGWKQVPGYTVASKDTDGSIYIAVQLHRP